MKFTLGVLGVITLFIAQNELLTLMALIGIGVVSVCHIFENW